MEFTKISFWEALKAGRPAARYEANVNGTSLYLTELEYRAMAGEMDGAADLIGRLKDAKTEAESAVAGHRRETEEIIKRAQFDEDYIALQHEEIAALGRIISARDREASALRAERDQAQVMLSNSTNGNCIFDFLKTQDPAVQRYAADFLKACMPKNRRGDAKVYDNDHHDRPRPFDRLLEHLRSIPYLTEIHWHGSPPRKTGVIGIHLEDDNRYWVDVAYGHNTFNARLKIYTTARSDREANFVGYCVGLLMK